jgi:hypothetical protein
LRWLAVLALGRLMTLVVSGCFRRASAEDRRVALSRTADASGRASATMTLTASAVLLLGCCVVRAQPVAPVQADQGSSAPRATDGSVADGTLEGAVTLGCESAAVSCAAEPYQVNLLLQGAGGTHKLIVVSADGHFKTAVAPGVYSLISADTRSSFNVPLLRPMIVSIVPGQTTRIQVRFQPGPELPTR